MRAMYSLTSPSDSNCTPPITRISVTSVVNPVSAGSTPSSRLAMKYSASSSPATLTIAPR